MRRFLFVCVFLLSAAAVVRADSLSVVAGDARLEVYLPRILGKRVGIVTNHSGIVQPYYGAPGGVHIVDTLKALGVDIQTIFAPEHGFRGEADAGEKFGSYTDPRTGIKVRSLYGASRKPRPEDISALDAVLFDIQDVGTRFYTYLSTLHYVMESCAELGVKLIVLDRPNPNGFYVDGPILDPKYRSFVGMHPIPVVHGMTLGELARMINGEGWLPGRAQCDLEVVPCQNYTHATRTEITVPPSPSMPSTRAVYLYPSLCYLEATPVSIGRGTPFPFMVYGHPDFTTREFSFSPASLPAVKKPPLEGRVCYGVDLTADPSVEYIWEQGIDLSYLIDAYQRFGGGGKFFVSNLFEKLIGVDYVRPMILAGKPAEEIEAMWRGDVEKFHTQRRPYLLYEE